MPNANQSFVPDIQTDQELSNTGSGTTPGPYKKSAFADVLIFVSAIVLAASLALAAGVYLYTKTVDNQLNKAKQSLQILQTELTGRTVEELKILDAKLRAASEILRKHVAVSEIFRSLERLTLKSVQFTNFDFQKDEKGAKLKLEGKALNVNAVAFQSKVFGANRNVFLSPIFSDLDIGSGYVGFKVNTDINPDLISFEASVLRSSAISGLPQNSESISDGIRAIPNNQNQTAPSGGAHQGIPSASAQNQGGTLQTDEFGNIIQ